MNEHLLKLANLYRLRNALAGLAGNAGQYWRGQRRVQGSSHVPPDHRDVPRLMEEYCAQVEQRRRLDEPAGAASFALWRLLWIPPFPDGNGRVARAVCHLVVRTACDRYPPVNLVLDPLSADRPPYLAALEAAHCEHRHSGAVPEMGALRTLVAEAMRAT